MRSVNLQLTIQIATLVSVVVGFVSLINAIRSYHKQMNVQILMKYTERYERILESFPEDGLAARFDPKLLPQAQSLHCVC
jgi:hypothetical protein